MRLRELKRLLGDGVKAVKVFNTEDFREDLLEVVIYTVSGEIKLWVDEDLELGYLTPYDEVDEKIKDFFSKLSSSEVEDLFSEETFDIIPVEDRVEMYRVGISDSGHDVFFITIITDKERMMDDHGVELEDCYDTKEEALEVKLGEVKSINQLIDGQIDKLIKKQAVNDTIIENIIKLKTTL